MYCFLIGGMSTARTLATKPFAVMYSTHLPQHPQLGSLYTRIGIFGWLAVFGLCAR